MKHHLILLAVFIAGSAGAQDAETIHRTAIVIDSHSDTTPKFEKPEWDFSERHNTGDMDIPRIREGGLDAQFFSIYMPSTPGDGAAIKTAIRRIDSVHETVRKHPDDLMMAYTVADIRTAAEAGKLACLMGVEGGHIIEDELAALRMYFVLGVRYMTLTHSFNTNWADAAGTGESVRPEHDGLTDFGREIVLEMNRLGMMVDISHVADTTFWDALEISKAPLIATHSSCRAITDHPRNMSDEMIKAMAEKGGVIMINFFSGYIDEERSKVMREYSRRRSEVRKNIKDSSERRLELEKLNVLWRKGAKVNASVVVDHIEHVINTVGADYVGLGADWDGVPELPEGLEDISKLPYVTEELLRRGHSAETVHKVMGENLLRVMAATEQVAADMN